MQLPKIVTPTYELTLPSDGRKVTYRPFLVQEEKIFLLTLEGLSKNEEDLEKNQRSILSAIQKIAENCIIAPKLDIPNLPIFDMEYIFIQLRAKSINDKLDLYFEGRTGDDITCADCKKQKHVEVDLNTIEVKKDKKHTNKIKITEEVGVIMKYPSFGMYGVKTEKKFSDEMFDMVTNCIQSIYDKENVYEAKDFTPEEMKAWIDQFDKKQFEKIQAFFETMPKIFHRVEWECKGCKFKQHFDLEKLEDFFE